MRPQMSVGGGVHTDAPPGRWVSVGEGRVLCGELMLTCGMHTYIVALFSSELACILGCPLYALSRLPIDVNQIRCVWRLEIFKCRLEIVAITNVP